jgi:hypothetical protein
MKISAQLSLLTLIALVLLMILLPQTVRADGSRFPGHPALEVTPTPRPPSESGQNISLIVGAAILVLIVAAGVLLETRRKSKTPPDQH